MRQTVRVSHRATDSGKVRGGSILTVWYGRNECCDPHVGSGSPVTYRAALIDWAAEHAAGSPRYTAHTAHPLSLQPRCVNVLPVLTIQSHYAVLFISSIPQQQHIPLTLRSHCAHALCATSLLNRPPLLQSLVKVGRPRLSI